ncbi:uncharacterized protein [Medicago truncatula]|uniref:uncharacterized protein n=1 Tax=Medicago truncatula TaxID=3880 RepID=UPI000D2F220A|nr:uncharacterized protein LOC112420212 [Medicago truncatula]
MVNHIHVAYRNIVNNDIVMLQHRVPGHWNSIWNLKLPPKVKNFIWRVCRNCLPTRMRLITKGVNCPTSCAICDICDEDAKHLFFECCKSVVCWQQVGLWHTIQQVRLPTSSCADMIFTLLKHLDIPQQQFWKNAQDVRNRNTNRNTHGVIDTWEKPSPGRFKCNVDASFSTTLNKVGFGACIRDAEGNFVIARTAWTTPLLDVDMGEAMGLLAALKWVKELNMVHMDFETDSKVVADSIYGKEGVSDFMAIINDCRHLLSTDLVNSDVKFIRRQVNGVAHSLAKEALHHASLHIHLNIPHCISSLINNEKL